MKQVIILSTLVLFLIILSFFLMKSPTITGKVYYSNQSTPFRINTIYPFQHAEMDECTKFFFYTDENLYCKLYTNYTGKWKASVSKILAIRDKDTAVFFNVTKPGKYEWDIFCETFEGKNDTWAHERRRSFIIKEPIIINQSNETNS